MMIHPAFGTITTRVLVGLVSMCCLVSVAAAEQYKTLIWPYFSFPPYVIVEDDESLSGISVEIRKMLLPAFPDYRHERVNSPINRTLQVVEEGRPYCLIGLLKNPERERILQYSKPCRLSPPPVAVTLRGRLDAHKKDDGRVSLRELLSDASLTIGHMDGFSHGPVLDGIIKENMRHENVLVIHDMRTMERQVELLLTGRIQYFVTVPDQALYVINKQNQSDQIEMVRLTESTEWIYGYVACARGEWSEEVIERVNTVLERVVQSGELKALYKDSLPQVMWPEFEENWDRLMLPMAEGVISSK